MSCFTLRRGILAAAFFPLMSCAVLLEDRTQEPLFVTTPGDEVQFQARTTERGSTDVTDVELQVLGGPRSTMFGGPDSWFASEALGRCNSTVLYRYRVRYTVDYGLFTGRETRQFPRNGVFAREAIIPIDCTSSIPAGGRLFSVNDPRDIPDARPGDGVCSVPSSGQVCTLRAAVMEANASPGADLITLEQRRHTLTRQPAGEIDSVPNDAVGDLDITDSVVILGAGRRFVDIGAVLKTSRETLKLVDSAESIDRTDNDAGFARVDGGSVDRVFQVHEIDDGNGFAVIRNIAIVNGLAAERPGGGIYNEGILRLDRVILAENRLAQMGMSRGRFTGSKGAGIANSGSLLATDLAVVRNRFVGGDGIAGGLSNTGEARINRALFAKNEGRFVATILNTGEDAELQMVNSMIVESAAATEGSAIIQNQSGGELELYFSTVGDNTSDNPPFLTVRTLGVARTRIGNTIISDFGQFDCSGRMSSLGRNIVGNPSGSCDRFLRASSGVGDVIGRRPNIGIPSRNGGFLFTTPIRAPQPDVVDAGRGLAVVPLWDARGRDSDRTRDGDRDGTAEPDIGAFELR